MSVNSNYIYIVDTKLWAYYLVQRNRPISDIINKIADLIYSLKKKGEVYVCFDIGHSDFREAEQSHYKKHRRSAMAKKSIAEQEAHKLFNETYAKLPEIFKLFEVYTMAVQGVEADDLVSLIVEKYRCIPDTKITLITNDHDYYHMVVEYPNVRFYNGEMFMYQEDVQREYNMKTRREFSILKSIVGDKSDNIKFIKNIAEVKGTELFNSIMCKFEFPTNDEIIREIEEYVKDKPKLGVHQNHVDDGRDTVREAFESNMCIADPFTDTKQLTKEQEKTFLTELNKVPKAASEMEVMSKCLEVFGYPVQLTEIAKKVYNVG